MDTATLPVALPFVMCGLTMLALVGMIGFILVRRIRQDLSPEGKQALAHEARQWLDQQVPRLAPWQPGAVGDISDFTDYTWTRFVTEKARGTIMSVSGNEPIVAYVTIRSFTRRWLFVRTTAHHLNMAVHGDRVDLEVDGAPLGSWRTSDGALVDPAGRTIGSAPRPSTWTVNRLPINWNDRWYDVTLHDQVLGAVLAQRGLRQTGLGLRKRAAAVTPAVTTAEGGRWLLALVVAELGWHSSRSARAMID